MRAHEEEGADLRRTMEIISVFSICSHVGGMNDKRSEKYQPDFAYFKVSHGGICTSLAIFVSV
jgi:hypothetical protein